MGVGPNYVLNKGMLVQGTTAIVQGELLVPGTAEQTVIRATSAANLPVVFVATEDIDATRVTTGKAQVGAAILGIARVLAGAGVTVGARVGNNTSARAVAVTAAGAGVVPKTVFGICLSIVGSNTTTVDGDYIDVLLTPGATF